MNQDLHKNAKWAINLEAVSCSSCETRQPVVRMPKNLRQLFWGGWTCVNCGLEMDKFGEKLK